MCQHSRAGVYSICRPSFLRFCARARRQKKDEGDRRTVRDRAGCHGGKETAVYAAKTSMRIRQRKSRGRADQLVDQKEGVRAEKEEKLDKEARRQV